MVEFEISLHPQFTEVYQRVVLKYLRSSRTLSKAEWSEALTGFDRLSSCIVMHQERRLTFRRFYEEEIEQKYATRLITNLLNMEENIESEGAKLASAMMSQAIADLEEKGLREPLRVGEKLLLAFCTYWWGAFAKGYITEVAIFRDLEKEGIQFQAHDLLSPAERFSDWDLIVDGMEGDIKSSTYFLHVTRSFPLKHAFYITSLFDKWRRRYLRVVIMKKSAWNKINGETVPTTLELAFDVFPIAGEILVREQRLVIVEYALWKTKIRTKQKRGG